jgi:hypothetical protein
MSVLDDEIDVFLDELRESGDTNMWGAAPYIQSEFGLSRKESRDHLLRWIKSFSERHPELANRS